MEEAPYNHTGIHVNLFLADRPCLVVGGGKVAWRKIQLLLNAGAKVAAVSPEVSTEVAELVEKGLITHTVRPFEVHDVEGAALVYAATNSRAVNRTVLECCREKNILCCCVDGNWAQGDFTTPAITHHNQLMLSVSSGGNDCRQSKMVKNSLERHLKMMDAANLVVVGTDHNHLTVEEREPFHLTGHRFERGGFMIMQLWGIHEFMILNTCNRVEVVAVVSNETARNGILRHVMGFATLKEDKFYLKTGQTAFEHLCLVTAGMLSQTPGENHITAQMKEALETAKQRGWAGNMVQEWVSSALHVSKHIKNQVASLLHSYEIEDLALRYLEANGKDLAASTIMVLGAGTIGKGLVKDSLPKAGKIIWCYHVNKPEIPADWNGKVELCTFNDMKERITDADIIVSATEAPGHLLHRAHAPFFNQERPVMVLDLGMPRNIDPELDDLSSDITVVDLDGLKYWYRRELTDMSDILTRCRAIVAEHQDLYEKIADSFKGGQEPV
ncbi:MAG: NAD(P)-dependent oxidoreductase [Verrucomicrobiota bacterium]